MKRTGRRLLIVIGLLGIGFVVGRLYGTFDVYIRSRSGNYLDVPSIHMAGIFDLGTVNAGTVNANYPGEVLILAYRPSSATSNPPRTLFEHWESGHIQIECHQGNPQGNNAFLVDNYDTAIKDKLILRDAQRQVALRVSSDGIRVKLDSDAVRDFLDFMAATPAPKYVFVAPDALPDAEVRGLYSIPTIGVQNVAATSSVNGGPSVPLVEPPSDPFRVMKQFCQ